MLSTALLFFPERMFVPQGTNKYKEPNLLYTVRTKPRYPSGDAQTSYNIAVST